jgi:hypothetical protein
LKSDVENAVSELENLRDECQGSFDNMPEGLQQGSTGELLEERVSDVETMIQEYEAIDFEDYTGPEVPEEGDIPEEFSSWLQEKLEEAQSVSYSGS